uniref:Putative secreted protein n=1 Tax=Anopheles triannulatus TaxID=58253 RepID=A0A2M4B6R6_9DIPT
MARRHPLLLLRLLLHFVLRLQSGQNGISPSGVQRIGGNQMWCSLDFALFPFPVPNKMVFNDPPGRPMMAEAFRYNDPLSSSVGGPPKWCNFRISCPAGQGVSMSKKRRRRRRGEATISNDQNETQKSSLAYRHRKAGVH